MRAVSGKGDGVLERVRDRVRPLDHAWIERAERRQRGLTKPEGSLGRLEEIANRLCAVQETLAPSVRRPSILLFAADHGVVAEGVSPYPQEVTAQMVANFLGGGAAINALAAAGGIRLEVVDVGVRGTVPAGSGLRRRPIGPGTRNFTREPAMTEAAALEAIAAGVESAEAAFGRGCRLLGIGEMGIGNTTSAAAVTAMLTGRTAREAAGRGAGADDATLRRKVAAVGRALSLHAGASGDPIRILSSVGGFEIGAMCGACLAGAAAKTPVVVDGFIATAAAALAVAIEPHTRRYLLLSHRSSEPGQSLLFGILGDRPLLDLGMRLGEGTGAALAMGLVRGAVAAFRRMATFESAGVAGPGRP